MTNYLYRQPEGCLQWHTTLTGRFQTFNFAETTTPQHLASQKCVKNYYFLDDVLWGKPIKLVQVASTTELSENQGNHLLFFEIVPCHICGASEVQTKNRS